MTQVKYQGPVTIYAMVDPEPGPSLQDQENALPKRDKIVQICQSDEMFTWVHALATILIINGKPFSGGLKVSQQLRMWQDRMRILKKTPLDLRPPEPSAHGSGHHMGGGNAGPTCHGNRWLAHYSLR